MANRRDRLGKTKKATSYVLAVAIHAAILGLMVFNFAGDPERIEAFDADKIDVVKASAVDESEIQKQVDQIKKADQQREKERQDRLDELERMQDEADKKKEDLAELDKKQKDEIAKTEKLEAEREAIALKKKEEELKAEQERKDREAQAKREKERLAKQKREREEAERKRKAAEEKKRQEAQELFQQQLQAEQQALADKRAKERTTTALNQAISRIGEKIKSLRTITPGVDPWRTSVVLIKMNGQGQVISANTIESSGDPRYDQDSEAAVYKASPLPLPDQTLYPDAYRRIVDTPLELEIKAN